MTVSLRARIAALLGAAAVLLAAAGPASAIPAFARKYQMSCRTCHAPFPRLTPYGEEFASRGFRMETAAQEPARAVYDVGDPLLQLARDLPLAVRLEGYASYQQDDAAELDGEWPWVWKILSGGPLSPKVSYYFYFLTEGGEVIGLEDAYVQINRPFGLPVGLRVGQFQVSDPLFMREVRLERSDYEIYKAAVGASRVDLTYDRGLVVDGALPGEVEVVFQLLNGAGIGGGETFDNDRFKNPSLRLSRAFGPVSAGVFAYYGREEPEGSAGFEPWNETWYLGPDLSAGLGPHVQLNLQYLERRDHDPFFTGRTGDPFETRGGFAELHVLPWGQDGRWVFSALYNKVTAEAPAGEGPRRAAADSADEAGLPAAESASLTANYLLARNVRVLLEGARDLEADRTRLTVGLITAF